ncbi:MAG: protein DpdJ, partial [bacterium]|nr:protein DpdJ [bacterium]
AFYLPALTRLAGMVALNASRWTRALAIYPRNELLKDQLTETIRQTQRLKPVLIAAKVRPLQVATFFGPTPKSADQVADGQYGQAWELLNQGRVCPFLVCPNCGGAMIWPETERARGEERLVCVTGDLALGPEDIVLTRSRLQREPADLLFTSTEMMNQRLTDSYTCHLFGIGQPANRRPALVLLDEAHTYAGTHGAQVAYLLRRWRHRSQAKPHFVGLSATLMEAAAFFAQLTGLPFSAVEEVSPERAEILQEGMEYMLALRGDPVSGASVLSTTIQTGMLLRRVLDHADRVSEGVFGQKVFVFTDDLDVTNRMYFSLLDAEGLNAFGQPDLVRHPGGSLANLRATTQPDQNRRFLHGQSWQLCENIGHDLDPRTTLRLGRVSSQDSGVDTAAEVIVATASLEVGFNDPDVGAVLQHKAPRDPASFLQRKGRAGRSRLMRPWTVVVLSDFGRDRLAYQGYDLMFDPELRPRELPLANRHVQKMQAAYACLDWLAQELNLLGKGSIWREASKPGGTEMARRRQTATAELIARVLDGGEEADRLREWLRTSLGLRGGEEEALLWEAPRALMTTVLPTLQRRLATQWTFNE